MCVFLVLNIFLLTTSSADLMNAFCISPDVCSISDLKLVSDSLPKGILEIFVVSRLNCDAKSFSSDFFHVYLVGLSFSSQTCASLMFLVWDETIIP